MTQTKAPIWRRKAGTGLAAMLAVGALGLGFAPSASAFTITSNDSGIFGTGGNALDDTNTGGGGLGNVNGGFFNIISNYEVANYQLVVAVNGVDVPDGYSLKVGDVVTWRWTIRDTTTSEERWYGETVGNVADHAANVKIRVDLPAATGSYLSAPTVAMQQYDEKGAAGGFLGVDPLTTVTLGAGAVGNSQMSATQSGSTIEAKWDRPPISSVAAVHEIWTGQELVISQTVTDLPNVTAQNVAYANPLAGHFGDTSGGGYRSWVGGASFPGTYGNFNLVLPVGQVDLGITVTANPAAVCAADGPDVVTYTVSATNSTGLINQDNADNVTVTTPLGNLTAARIAPGATASTTFNVTVPPGATSLTANLTTVSPSDSNPANNSATGSVTVLTDADGDGLCGGAGGTDPDDGNACIPDPNDPLCVKVADLIVSKTSDTPDGTEIGDQVTYTIVVTNDGPDTAINTRVTDLLPAAVTFVSATPSVGAFNSATGVWTVGDLADGAVQSLQIVTTINAADETGTEIANQACGVSDTSDPVDANNCQTATFTGTPLVNPMIAGAVLLPFAGVLMLRRRRRNQA